MWRGPKDILKDSLGMVNNEKRLYIILYILDFGHKVPEILYFTGPFIPATSQIRSHSSLYKILNPHRRHEGCDVERTTYKPDSCTTKGKTMTAVRTSWEILHKFAMPKFFHTQTSHLLYKCTLLYFYTNQTHSSARKARRQSQTSLHSHPPKIRMSHSPWLLKKGSWPGTGLFPEPCLVIV